MHELTFEKFYLLESPVIIHSATVTFVHAGDEVRAGVCPFWGVVALGKLFHDLYTPTYTQKSLVYTQKSPKHTQKSSIYHQKNPWFFILRSCIAELCRYLLVKDTIPYGRPYRKWYHTKNIVYININIYMCIYICIYIYIYMHINVCIHIYIYKYIYI